jgi:hypothetical protein
LGFEQSGAYEKPAIKGCSEVTGHGNKTVKSLYMQGMGQTGSYFTEVCFRVALITWITALQYGFIQATKG